MPSGLSAADRRLLWAAATLALAVFVATAVFAPAAPEQGEAAPSSYSSGSGGALAAYLLLNDLAYPVRRWEEPPAGLPQPGRGAVLILAEPTESPSKGESESLRRFVRSGGRILFCGASIKSFFPAAALSSRINDPSWKEFGPTLPSHISQGAGRVVLRPQAYWTDVGPSQFAIYGDQGRFVVTWRFGEGELLWWAGATPLTNAGIRRADNLRLFLNSISSPAGEPLSIYWDEYYHGQRGTLWSYAAGTPAAWSLLQMGLLALAALFSFSRRSGPIVGPAAVSRLSPLEFVETMGGLYQRAGAARIPVEVSYRRLRVELSRRLGLPARAPDAELEQAAAERLGFSRDRLAGSRARALRALSAQKLTAPQALLVVEELEGWFRALLGDSRARKAGGGRPVAVERAPAAVRSEGRVH